MYGVVFVALSLHQIDSFLRLSKDHHYLICQRCGVDLRKKHDIYKSAFYHGYVVCDGVWRELIRNFRIGMDKLYSNKEQHV